jgi:hypothetical protein
VTSRDQIIETMARAIAVETAGEEFAGESELKAGNLWCQSKSSAQAALQALEGGGWPPLPLEPTIEMQRVGAAATNRMIGVSDAYDIWKAMVSAFLEQGDKEGFMSSGAESAARIASDHADQADRCSLEGWVDWDDAPFDTTLWGVFGSDCFPTIFACQIKNHPQAGRVIWGFSVHEGEPGFRTLGTGAEWAEEHDLCLFRTREAAFAHVAGLFDPAPADHQGEAP